MNPHNPSNRTTWFFTFCECLLAAVALLMLLQFPLEFMPASFFEQYGAYFSYLLLGIAGTALLGSLIGSALWHRREQVAALNSPVYHAWLQGLIRYWLALSIASYGFAKLLKTQFTSPEYILDLPLGSADGMSLTWYYFGYSYPLAVIIGLLQIGGSVLLLYRRTTLLGVMLLLPVMVNIVLINAFYGIAVGAFFNSVVYTLALLFFLLQHTRQLKSIFWNLVNHLPPITLGRAWVKHSVRLLPIILAFASLKYLIASHPSDEALKGTWNVERLVRNGRLQPLTAWQTDPRAWSRVYFSGREGCAFNPNPYRFEPGESLVGSYEFDNRRNQLTVLFYAHDTLRARISNRTAEAMRLRGVLGRDTLDMQLSRLHR